MHFYSKKRGKFWIQVAIVMSFFLLSVYFVLAGFCLDPLSTFYCQEVTEDECCGGTCESGKYADTTEPPDDCEQGCCFALSGIDYPCQPLTTFKGKCENASGEFSAPDCSGITDSKCDSGCCCWIDNVNQSDLKFKGECDPLTESRFNNSISDVDECSDWCNTTSGGPIIPSDPECDDLIDNDGDGFTDFPSDPGCTSVADESEVDPNVACDDGLDNDGDGDTDSDDSCCQEFPNRKENFCDIDACTTSGQISSYVTECRCRDSYVCEGGQYCCLYGCYDSPCGAEECITGSRRSCGNFSKGCELFKYCYDGVWGTICTADPSCGVPYEICDDGLDNNANGHIDCHDVVCHGLECDSSESTCRERGYEDPFSGTYKCCYTGNVNDCIEIDGTPDTCGECNCLIAMPTPFMKSVEKPPGSSNISVKWGLNCDVDMYVYKCSKTATDCTDYNDFMVIASGIREREITDSDIEPNIEYCYYAQAEYSAVDKKNSDIMCVDSGDAACMEFGTTEFCLNTDEEPTGKRIWRAVCDASNKLAIIEKCDEVYGDEYICMGPFQGGKTECKYQSDCDECGDPLNMFADFVTSRTTYVDPLTGYPYDTACKDIPTCYWDYSDTTVDKFYECTSVYNCYNYRSEFACVEQSSGITDSNNKCLPRGCEWQPISGDLDRGICFETITEYRSCTFCNQAENNNIFDNCDFDRCRMFGNCYLKPDGDCSDASDIVCSHYNTDEHCTGGTPVQINTAYDILGERYTGDNSVVQASSDVVGLGLCRWDSAKIPPCFKDADGDTLRDPDQADMTPPHSRVLTGTKVLAINFTLSVSDPSPGGSPGMGVKYTYICQNNSAYCYPTKKYVPVGGIVYEEFGGGHGQHDIYYYSEDNANNLEIVKKFIVEIDKAPPNIQIEAFIVHDMKNYVNSNVTFVVIVDENSTCTDNLEGAASKIYKERGSMWVVQYTGLSDGFYQYKVVCQDAVGNEAEGFYDLRIDADGAIFDPKPQGRLDYSPVTLGVSTLIDATCKWGPEEEDFSRLPNTFSKQDMGTFVFHHANQDLSVSETYSYDVKCDVSGRISDDEIQFIYDITPPTTLVFDMNRKPFNFTNWYNGVGGKVFLDCVDEPENGFGCDKTYYCLDTEECTPDKLNDPLYSIEYELTPETDLMLCYLSTEKTEGAFGGLTEVKKCNAIHIDHDDPLLTIRDIGQYDTPDNPYTTYIRGITIRGIVIDPDAGSAPNNRVTIKVTDKDGNTEEYVNMPANNQFSKSVTLGLGLNTITVLATDRSGATDMKTVYILVAPYTGQKIILILPNKFGVSDTRVFDLRVQTYTQSDCRFSINDASFDGSEPMSELVEPQGEGFVYYYTKEDFELGSVSEVTEPVFIKCKDQYGALFSEVFNLSWDDSDPVIQDVYLDNSDGKEPPTVIEFPLSTNIIVETDDETRCKYSTTRVSFSQMSKFTGFDNQSLITENTQFFDNLDNPATYTYYFQCENGAGLLSEKYKLTFNVDTSAATGFTFFSPAKKSTNASFIFKLQTTKKTSECLYGPTSSPTHVMTAVDDKTHVSAQITLPEGKYTYHFQCKTFDKTISDTYSFTIDTTPPTKPVIDDGITSWYLVKLSAKWTSEDNLSKIKRFNFSIGTSAGKADVYDWHETKNNKITVTGLNLSNGSTYYWSVKAMNELLLWSAVGHSDGVTIDTSSAKKWTNGSTEPGPNQTTPIPPTAGSCYNAKKEDNETDIDCGGVCPPCYAGKKCVNDSDCLSKICKSNICAEASCDDGILNQGESDIDCGGPCTACPVGKGCLEDSDCQTGYCNNGFCDETTCGDGECEGSETCSNCEDDCGNCSNPIPGPNDCTIDGELDSDCDQMPDWWEKRYNLKVYVDDADEDPDDDDFTNLEEYRNGTDPTVADDVNGDHPTSIWTWIIIIVAALIIIGGGSYLGYEEYMKKQAPPKTVAGRAMPRARISVTGPKPALPKEKTPQEKYMDSLASMMKKKRKKLKSQERRAIMSEFETGAKMKPRPRTEKPAAKTSVGKATAAPKKASAVPAKASPTAVKAPGAKPKQVVAKKKSAPTISPKHEKALEGLREVAQPKTPDALKELTKITKKPVQKPKKTTKSKAPAQKPKK